MSNSSIPALIITSLVDGQIFKQKRFQPSPIEWVALMRFLKDHDINKPQGRKLLDPITTTNDMYHFAIAVQRVIQDEDDALLMVGCECAIQPKTPNWMETVEIIAKSIIIGSEMARNDSPFPQQEEITEEDLPY